MQKICANNNVKDVCIQHSAVLGHLYIAEAYHHINHTEGQYSAAILYLDSHCPASLDLGEFLQLAGSKTALKI